MKLEILDNVYQIKRIRLADDEPLVYETSFLSCTVFP
ncbi:UTRA domain-containing protein [Oceanobacillus sp. AG]|nr:UTRA domain-containing protein [Oceanobacillus sp. AG]